MTRPCGLGAITSRVLVLLPTLLDTAKRVISLDPQASLASSDARSFMPCALLVRSSSSPTCPSVRTMTCADRPTQHEHSVSVEDCALAAKGLGHRVCTRTHGQYGALMPACPTPPYTHSHTHSLTHTHTLSLSLSLSLSPPLPSLSVQPQPDPYLGCSEGDGCARAPRQWPDLYS